MTDTGVIAGVSVSHTLASVEEIESAQVADEETLVGSLLAREGVREAFALHTCNRAEAYVTADDAAAARAALSTVTPEVREGAVVHLDHEESLRHLMRVAAGLESLVLGEDQILGQLSAAADRAREAGALGGPLADALRKAVRVGKRARTETGVNEGTLSLGTAAVELARRERTLAGSTAVVVGAGEMGTLAARALDGSPVERVVVANRSLSGAEHVAAEIDTPGEAVPLADLPAVVREADLLVAATGADGHVVDAETLADAGETLCIDLGQPRDIDPAADGDAVDVRDIDDLESVTDETRAHRREEAKAVEAMIDAEFERLLEEFKRSRADEAISAMYEAAERTKDRELEEALAKLEAQGGLTDAQRETVEALADALVGQLLAAPTRSLREAAAEDDWNTIHTAMQLFDPEFDAPPPGPATPDGVDLDLDLDGDAESHSDVPEGVLDHLSED